MGAIARAAERPAARTRPRWLQAGWIGLLGATGCALAVAAPYKVVGPDGRITYTDRPPPGVEARPLGGRGAGPAAAGAAAEGLAANGVVLADLPFDLRPVVQRFPVLLLAGENCVPCDLGRAALRQRGIPFGERSVKSRADLEALRRQEGGGELPVLRIGGQRLRGFNGGEWSDYLDAAGYPKATALSSRYKAPAVEPLVAAALPAPAEAAPAAADRSLPAPPPPAEAIEPGKPRIRF